MESRSSGSRSTANAPASRRDRSSRSEASLVSRVTCSRISRRNSLPGVDVQVLVVQQLEEPAQREQRRAQLVRGVGDEVVARAVGLVEPRLHRSNARDSSPSSSGEGSPIGSPNSPIEIRVAARSSRARRRDTAVRRAPAHREGDGQRQRGGDQDPPLDQVGGGVDVADLLRQRDHRVRPGIREGDDQVAVLAPGADDRRARRPPGAPRRCPARPRGIGPSRAPACRRHPRGRRPPSRWPAGRSGVRTAAGRCG